MASRGNPLINWLNLSFDTFNLLHRWQGRIVVLEAIAHVLAWGASVYKTGGFAAVSKSINNSKMELYGVIVSIPPAGIRKMLIHIRLLPP